MPDLIRHLYKLDSGSAAGMTRSVLMDTKLKKFLDSNKIKYKLSEHKKVYTAFNEAETQHLKGKEVAKTVLIKADLPRLESGKAGKGFVLVVVPAVKHVDFAKVKKTLKAKKVSMAKESDITKTLKTKVGLIHPFGNLYGLTVLIDNALLKQKSLVASPGSYTESMEFKPKDFLKLVEALKGSFSK